MGRGNIRKLGTIGARSYTAGILVDPGWKDLGLGLEPADAAGAETAVGREAWKPYRQAREAGPGILGLLEPKP